MKAPRERMGMVERITALRRAIEALAPYAVHRPSCDTKYSDHVPCTCGLAEQLAAAQRLCVPNKSPAHYTPRKFG